MKRMKTFFRYFLILVGLYIISNFFIEAFIKTSYSKITEYNIDVNEATVTILQAKASRDDGYIEGKISNSNEEDIYDKYMVVELFSESHTSLGKEYCKIDVLKAKKIKDFKVRFFYDNVKSFKITFIDEAEKQKIDEQNKNQKLFDFNSNSNSDADKIIKDLRVKSN